MKLLPKTSDERSHYLILAFLLLSAFALRVTAIVFTMSVPGDGTARATRAYVWSQSPFFRTYGHWLRGYEYLAGTFGFLSKDPIYSSRLLNLMLGTLTILVFYILIRKIYDSATALISTSILAFFPLHIGLSASSFNELSFAMEFISGTLFLIFAAEAESAKNRALYLVLSLFFLCLAEITRYEAWVLIPALLVYYFWKRRKIFESLLIMTILLAFPFMWTLNNYLYMSAPFKGFTSATLSDRGAQPVSLVDALRIMYGRTVHQLGWIVPFLAVAGVALQFFQAVRRKIDARKMLYILITCIFWAGVFAYAVARGTKLFDRFLLLGFIMALPFSALPLTYYYRRYKERSLIVIFMAIAVVVSVLYQPQALESLNDPHNKHLYVTLRSATEMKHTADWLKNSPYRESSVLLTYIEGQSAYLSGYFPEVGSRRFIIKFACAEDNAVQRFLKSKKPSLLITYDGDNECQSRIGNLLGTEIGADKLIHTEGHIKVYHIGSAAK